MKRITERLAFYRTLTDGGFDVKDDIEFKITVAAFRLNQFHRCPKCDAPTIMYRHDDVTMRSYLACGSCRWTDSFNLLDVLDADNGLDDIVLGICRKVLTGG